MAQFLRRYTNLPALIHLLTKRKITLLDPESWDDKNDSRFLTLYGKKNSLKTVLALCFAKSRETYHRWRVFADGPSGVCVRFDRKRLDLGRHSPDDSRTGVNIRAFPVSLEERTPTGTLGQPERLVEGLIWPSPWHLDALLLSVALERMMAAAAAPQ
jgi:hypothetical protein